MRTGNHCSAVYTDPPKHCYIAKIMKTIKINEYLNEISAVVDAVGFELEGVEVVPSIKEWCAEKDIEENNLHRTGKCLVNRDTGKYLILLAEEIKAETISSIITAMDIKGLYDKTDSLNSSWAFLKHLLLHELSHAINPEFSELECDNWAFEQMVKIAI